MKRRIFVRNAALSAISLGTGFTGALPLGSLIPTHSAKQWLAQLGWALSTKRRSAASIAPEALAKTAKETNEYLQIRGYLSNNDTFYFWGDQESWCFYPLYLHRGASNTADILLPVFHRDATNNWHRVKTLSAFQVEALAQAAQALSERTPEELHDLLMPAFNGLPSDHNLCYATVVGKAKVSTQVINQVADTECTITESNNIVFHKTFPSRHA